MTTHLFSAAAGGPAIDFDPFSDELHFDSELISAADIAISMGGSSTVLAVGTLGVTLDVVHASLTTANITFADGSLLVIGDNQVGTTNDGAANTLSGGAGDDLLIGGGGADSVSGGAGDDVLAIVGVPQYGNDTLDGGAGNDRVTYLGDSGVGLQVNLGTGYDTTPGANFGQFTGGTAIGGDGNPGSTLRLLGIEAASGTPNDDLFNGNSNSLVTGGADDLWQRFEGLGGDDILNGAVGDGRVTIAEYAGAPAGVVVNLDAGGGLGTALDGHGGTDTLVNIDGVVGSAFDDSLTGGGDARDFSGSLLEMLAGGGGSDFISGGMGRDILDGGPGADTLDGGGDEDTLDGGAGADVLSGGAGDDAFRLAAAAAPGAGRIVFFVEDLVVEAGGEGADTAYIASSYALPAGVENLVLAGAPMWRAYTGTGNELDNRITGEGEARHVLDGGGGSDTLDGGGGNDVLIWDAADALVDGGAGTDTLRIVGSAVALDLAGIAGSVIQDVEIIDLGAAAGNSLALGLAEVLALSSTTDTLRVDGGGSLDMGGGWTQGADQDIGGVPYRAFTQDAATLLIHPDIVL